MAAGPAPGQLLSPVPTQEATPGGAPPHTLKPCLKHVRRVPGTLLAGKTKRRVFCVWFCHLYPLADHRPESGTRGRDRDPKTMAWSPAPTPGLYIHPGAVHKRVEGLPPTLDFALLFTLVNAHLRILSIDFWRVEGRQGGKLQSYIFLKYVFVDF